MRYLHFTSILVFLSFFSPLYADVPSVDTSDIEAVRNHYYNYFCQPDLALQKWYQRAEDEKDVKITDKVLRATEDKINFLRTMAGLRGDIRVEKNSNAAAAALFAASIELDELDDDDMDWSDISVLDRLPNYSAAAQESFTNRLVISGLLGPRAVDYLMPMRSLRDYRLFYNTPRKLPYYPRQRENLLDPELSRLGMGISQGQYEFTSDDDDEDSVTAFVPFFEGGKAGVPSPFLSWPPEGYVPYPIIGQYWTIEYPGADFTSAQPRRQKTNSGGVFFPGGATGKLPIGALERKDRMVWRSAEGSSLNRKSEVEPYTVAVSGAVINGEQQNFDYTVNIFDPHPNIEETVRFDVRITNRKEGRRGDYWRWTLETTVGPGCRVQRNIPFAGNVSLYGSLRKDFTDYKRLRTLQSLTPRMEFDEPWDYDEQYFKIIAELDLPDGTKEIIYESDLYHYNRDDGLIVLSEGPGNIRETDLPPFPLPGVTPGDGGTGGGGDTGTGGGEPTTTPGDTVGDSELSIQRPRNGKAFKKIKKRIRLSLLLGKDLSEYKRIRYKVGTNRGKRMNIPLSSKMVYKISTADLGPGTHQIRVIARMKDGRRVRKTLNVTFPAIVDSGLTLAPI